MGGHTPDLLTCGILRRVTLVAPTLNSLLRPWNNYIVSLNLYFTKLTYTPYTHVGLSVVSTTLYHIGKRNLCILLTYSTY